MNSVKGIAELVLFIAIFICLIVYLPLKDILYWLIEISIDIHLLWMALVGAFFIGAAIIAVIKHILGKE